MILDYKFWADRICTKDDIMHYEHPLHHLILEELESWLEFEDWMAAGFPVKPIEYIPLRFINLPDNVSFEEIIK